MFYSRRNFIQQGVRLTAGALALPGILNCASPNKKREWGVILNTVKNEMAEDYQATLEQLRAMGYRYVEGGVYGDSAGAYAKFLQSIGLRAVAGGSSMSNLQKNLGQYIQNGQDLGYEYLVCYWPWLSSADRLTEDECLETANRLNQVGRQLKKEGLRLAWHNHDKEFTSIGEQTAFEILLENTNPEWVTCQMDLYWVYKGGDDPIKLFRKYPGRFELFHVKDMAPGKEGAIACAGAGKIEFQPIFDHAKQAGVKYAMVEHERTMQGLQCAEVSIEHLKHLK